ncbi:hypothetical protein [Streptomyces sp. NPDC050704]|uniref:hypothetical protein n=1 Tax=Streptomyces sp. NPDC050704 TaxID=3157219 RepID=UPI003432AA32
MSWNFAIFLIAGVATVSIVALLTYGVIRTFPSATPAKMAVLITAISGLVGAIAAVIYAFGGVPGPPPSVVTPEPAVSVNSTGTGSW